MRELSAFLRIASSVVTRPTLRPADYRLLIGVAGQRCEIARKVTERQHKPGQLPLTNAVMAKAVIYRILRKEGKKTSEANGSLYSTVEGACLRRRLQIERQVSVV
ncbi:hypothetical protein V3C99_018205 [Haemonchus contortus]|uniref:DNA-directed RNA polymerase III subunit RPC3 n=1 Tax=Haemonchus contortus TaxID=6289 RepID=A0A7I5EE32_HAECO